MKKFSLLLEQNELINSFSNEYKGLKTIIYDLIKPENKQQLINDLTTNTKSFEAGGKNTLLLDIESKMDFLLKNDALIDSVLEKTEWFARTPIQLGFKSLTLYLDKGIDVALNHVMKAMLNDLNK